MDKKGLTLKTGLIITISVLLIAIVAVLVYYGITASDDRTANNFLDGVKTGGQLGGGNNNNLPICGDGFCEQGETPLSCSSDCSSSGGTSGGSGNNTLSGIFTISILSPSDGAVYGNSNISLEFQINDSRNVLSSCWYTLNEGNRTAINCQSGINTYALNISQNGLHTLRVSANSTDRRVIFKEHDFWINIGAPTIEMISPSDGAYIGNKNVEIKYKPVDSDLSRCELISNFGGSFSVNQTHSSPQNSETNTFSVANLLEKTHSWRVRCFDSSNKNSTTSVRNFTVDITKPTLNWVSLIYNNQTQKVEARFSVADSSPVECSIDYSGSSSSQGSYSSCTGTTTIGVEIPQNGIYNVIVNARDLAGNLQNINRNITLNLQCGFSSATWSTRVAENGESVQMFANGTIPSECDGKEVNFRIFKQSGSGGVFLANKRVNFTGKTAVADWEVGSGNDSDGINGLIIPVILQASTLFGAIILNRKGKLSNHSLLAIAIALGIVLVFLVTNQSLQDNEILLQPVQVDNYYYVVNLVGSSGVNMQSTLLSTPGCGNNFREAGEQCDGNDFGNFNNSCFNFNPLDYSSGNIACSQSCTRTFDSCISARCGDGIKNTNEQCDDGNTNNGDGCSSMCEDEYIRNAQDLWEIRSKLNGHHILANDIDLAGYNFVPIGNANSPFTGTFDGKGYRILNLQYGDENRNNAGLFGASLGTIKDVQIVNANMHGQNNVGALVGSMSGGSVRNVVASGSVSGSNAVGGLVGSMSGGSITESSANVGLSGNIRLGGFVGLMSGGNIEKSFSKGSVNANLNNGDITGGFVGLMSDSSIIRDSYTHSNVNGKERVGGFAGRVIDNALIDKTYSKGSVSGVSTVGGFIGTYASATVTSSYWNNETSSQAQACGFGSCSNVLPRTTAQMTVVPTTETYVGWNFLNIWSDRRNNGQYPWLKWEDN